MSYDVAFWQKGPKCKYAGHAIYRRLRRGLPVPGLRAVPRLGYSSGMDKPEQRRRGPLTWLAARTRRFWIITAFGLPLLTAVGIGLGSFALGTVVLLPLAPTAAALIAGALLFFNVLDGVFDFCVGCWMYATFLLPRGVDS